MPNVVSRAAATGWLVLIALTAGLWLATPAAAHATLVSSSPTDGAHLDAAPTELVIDVTEPVTLVEGSAQLLAADGARYPFAAQRLENGRTRIALQLGQPLPDGAYLATARVVSADTHVVSLSVRFGVGVVGDDNPWAGRQPAQAAPAGGWFDPLKAAVYTGLVLSAGLLAACRWVWPEWLRSTRFRIVHRFGTVLLLVGLTGRLVVRIADQAGGLSGVTATAVRDVLCTPFGAALVVATAAAVASLVRPGAPTGVLSAATALIAVTLGGHGGSAELWPLPFVVTFLHVYAAAVWLGGVAAIALVLTHEHGEHRGIPRLRRWHRVAAGHLAAVAAAGLGLAVLQVRPPAALFSTSYGWTLLLKVVLVAATAVAGFLVYRHNRDDCRKSGAPDAGGSVLTRTRAVVAEAVAALAVIAVTSALASLPPARDSYTTEVAVPLNFGGDVLDVDVDTIRRGPQVVTVRYPAARDTAEVDVELSSAQANVARMPVPMSQTSTAAGALIWTSDNLIVPAPGTWKLTVRFDNGQGPRLASFYYEVL